MIDKTDFRLTPSATFSRPVTSLIRRVGVMRPSQHYRGTLDLRPHGFDAMLHYSKRRDDRSHKLELLETGKKTHSDLVRLIESIVDGDSGALELMRIDLCADVPDVPVSWFHENARVRFKQRERRIGPLTFNVISRTNIETLTFGAKPSVIRIYDKVTESKMRFKRDCRKQSRDADALEFEREYGFKERAIVTRIERQYGGGRIPDELRTFAMIANAAAINPFETFELNSNHVPLPRVEDYELGEWLKGMRLRTECIERGAHEFRRWLNKHANGNSARILRRYAAFLPGSTVGAIGVEDILAIYRRSTVAQLAA